MKPILTVTSLLLALALAGCPSTPESQPKDSASATDTVQDTVPRADVATGDLRPQWDPVEPHVEQIGHFTVVYLAGTAYEMGYQQGELLHDTIGEALVFVENDVLLSSLPVLAEKMGILDAALENSYPDLLDECQGIIDAAGDTGFNMDLCLALNFGDVMLEFMALGVPGPGCASLIATGDATPDGRILHGRNLDWGSMNIDIIHQQPVIFVRQPSDGIPHVYVGFPLNLSPYTGMNLAGIAIGSHEADPAGPEEQAVTGRSHVQMLGQLMKHATSLDDVRSFVQSESHMSAELFTVSDGPNRTGAIFEMTATAVVEREFTDDILYATNHFLHPEMVPRHAPPAAGSVNRIHRFQQLADKDGKETLWGDLDENGLAAIMRDPINPALGVAQSDEELEALGWDNDGGIGVNGPMHFVIFDPAARLFYVNAGILPLHKQPYQCFSLEELLGLDDATPCPQEIIP